MTDDTRELAPDTGTEMLEKLEEEASEHKTPFVARVHARARARASASTSRSTPRELHFFDLETGAGSTRS